MTVLQVCAFSAPNAGNFIASLTKLEDALQKKGIQTIYAFSEEARNRPWCQVIQKRTTVYFLPTAKARILPRTYRIFRHIYAQHSVDIVHSHFELYDIPATVTAPKKAKIFWHLHDPIQIEPNIRALLWKIQYGFVGKRAQLLSVSDYYRHKVIELGFPEKNTQNIYNGINLSRIKDAKDSEYKTVDFLTFGWDFFRKGDDLILDACKRLAQDGYRFRLILNGNDQTWDYLNQYLDGPDPEYLTRGTPVDDSNVLFQQSRVFIQASRRETFSYAVCEAAYAGLPVISSNIAGLDWAHELPTVSFFPSENTCELYKLMKQYLDGKTLSDQQIEESRSVIREKYSLEVWTKQIMQAYMT